MLNSPTEMETGEAPKPAPSEQGHVALFANDQGNLPLEARRALVQLLLGPAIDARRQTKLWPNLLRHESVLRSRLHELFLELIIDRDQEVAFTRQVVSDELDVPVLLRRAPLTFLDSVLLLFLRQRLTQSDAQGERAVLALQEMIEHLTIFERQGNVDHARFERQMNNAIEKAKKHSLLQKLRGSDDRYEVSPTLKLLFPAEEIQALAAIYANLAATAGDASAEEEEPASDPDDGEQS
jgi:F0F1-type ATP synthase delta subunit